MFTKKEIAQLTDPYFYVIRITENFYEVQSRNTGHCWLIMKTPQGSPKKPVVLYHKHRISDYYHVQRELYTVSQALSTLKNHDSYVLGSTARTARPVPAQLPC